MAKKKAKLPKKVLGVKLPKKARKGPLAEFVMSPIGQGILTEAIYHAGAAFARQQSRSGSTVRNPMESLREAGFQATGKGGKRLKRRLGDGGNDLYYAFSSAAEHFMHTLQGGGSHSRDEDEADKGAKPDRKQASKDDEGERIHH